MYGERDTTLVLNILAEDVAGTALERLKEEVKWHKMYHRGGEVPRLVAVEGEIAEDGRYGPRCFVEVELELTRF